MEPYLYALYIAHIVNVRRFMHSLYHQFQHPAGRRVELG